MCILRPVEKGKAHTLGMAPLSKGTSLQMRSGMARVVEGFHSFTCIPTRLSTNGMANTCLCLPSRSWSSVYSVYDRYVTSITVVSRINRHASLGN